MIENLPLLVPDPARTDRTIARCREKLARRRARIYILERAAVAAVSVVYLIAMARDLVDLYR